MLEVKFLGPTLIHSQDRWKGIFKYKGCEEKKKTNIIRLS